MTDLKLSDLNDTEKSKLIEEIDGDKAGCGILHDGKYHILAYRPVKDTVTYKCTGTELFIYKKEDSKQRYSHSAQVLFKQSWLSKKESFKLRLEKTIKNQTDLVIGLDKAIDNKIARVAKEKKDHEQAIRDHTDKIRSCQLKLDSTMKTLAPNAKSMIEYNNERLLTAKETEENIEKNLQKIEEERMQSQEFWTESAKVVNHRFDFDAIQKSLHKGNIENEYMSERDKQAAINEVFLHMKQKEFKQKYPEDFVKEFASESKKQEDNIKKTKAVKLNEDVVIDAGWIEPADAKYLTDTEKKEAITVHPIKLASPNILR